MGAPEPGERLLVISPVRNEAGGIQRVADAMATQRRRPDLWLVVDDGSEDGTLELLRGREVELPFLRTLAAPQRPLPAGADRLRFAAEAAAFKWGLGQAGADWHFIGKLDGDIVLDPGHFERLLTEFRRDARLGLAGCYLESQEGGRWRIQEMPAYHVNGAVKLYRRDCFEQIGGMLESLGWDTADETYARMAGWRTHSFRDLRARHLKPSGSVGGRLRGRARHGECVWIVDYPASIVLLRSLRLLRARPPLLASLAFAFGYARARLRRTPQVPDPRLLRFSRAEQRRRLRAALRRPLSQKRTK